MGYSVPTQPPVIREHDLFASLHPTPVLTPEEEARLRQEAEDWYGEVRRVEELARAKERHN